MTSPRAAREPLVLPRGLIFLASLWLMASWLISIGLRPPVQPSAASYMPSVRIMIFSIGLGVCVGWPLLRLSEAAPARRSARRTLFDMIVLLALIQVVVWPLRLVTTWNTERTLLIDGTLVAWTLIIGALIAVAAPAGHLVRTLAMVLCMLLAAAGWLVVGLVALTGAAIQAEWSADLLVRAGALTSLHHLTGGDPGPVERAERAYLVVVAIAAAVAWTVALASAALARDDEGPR